MTAYAPSDTDQVRVSPPHGCGQTHVRPAGDDGQPASLWALDCQACHKYLTGPLGGWGGTSSEIPETYDEKLRREDREKRATGEQEKALGNLPDNLARALGSVLGHPGGAGEIVRCANDHPNLVSAKFCGECLVPMGSLTVSCPAGHENDRAVKFCGECGTPVAAAPAAAPQPSQATVPAAPPKRRPLKDWKADELRTLARSKGLSDEGTRAGLLARIRAAKAAA
jgi:hypothetical protein